jgi:hypothetical protein
MQKVKKYAKYAKYTLTIYRMARHSFQMRFISLENTEQWDTCFV